MCYSILLYLLSFSHISQNNSNCEKNLIINLKSLIFNFLFIDDDHLVISDFLINVVPATIAKLIFVCYTL